MICKMRQQPTRRSVVDLTQGPARTLTGYDTAEPNPSSNVRRFFAVVKGRQTGVFTCWHKVLKLVKGYPGAVHKRFRREEDYAHEWLAQWIDSDDLTEDDDATFTTSFEPGRTAVPPDIGGNDREDVARAGTMQAIENIIDVTKIGSDTSIGNSKEIYGTSIQVEPEVQKTLCPKGVIAPVCKELMDSTVDVTSLPGKYNASNLNTDGTIMMDQFAEAVGDLTEPSARRVGESRTHWDTRPMETIRKKCTQQDQDRRRTTQCGGRNLQYDGHRSVQYGRLLPRDTIQGQLDHCPCEPLNYCWSVAPFDPSHYAVVVGAPHPLADDIQC
jgi:hypothetical protein